MLQLKFSYLGHLMRRVDSLEKTLMLGKNEGKRRRRRRRMRWLDGITDSVDMIWANCGRCGWTGKPGVLQSMGMRSQTRLSDWTTTKSEGLICQALWCSLSSCFIFFFSGETTIQRCFYVDFKCNTWSWRILWNLRKKRHWNHPLFLNVITLSVHFLRDLFFPVALCFSSNQSEDKTSICFIFP